MSTSAAEDPAYRSAVLDQVFGLLQPDATWPADEVASYSDESDQAYQWACEAREYGDRHYSIALTLALAEAAAVALEQEWNHTFESFYCAALATGAPSAFLGRVARRMFAGAWFGQLMVLVELDGLDRDDALEIGRSALRLDDVVLQHNAVNSLINLYSEAEPLGGEVDCCEVLDTSPDPPSPFVRAAHFMLAASLPGRQDEALDVHLPRLEPSDYENDSLLNSVLVEHANIYFDQVTVYDAVAIAARTWAAAGTAAPEWVDATLAPVVARVFEETFDRWDRLVPWSPVYWTELYKAVVASEEGGALHLLAYESLYRLAGERGSDADTRAVAADVIGLLVEQWPAVTSRMRLAEALIELVDDKYSHVDEDVTVWMSVARALAGFAWLPHSELLEVVEALETLEASRSEMINNEAYEATATLWGALDHPALPAPTPGTGLDSIEVSNHEWLDSLGLYRWQREALQAWVDAGRCGVIEAVTGAGKTRVALAAIGEAVIRGCAVAVLVPSVELVRQWRREIEQQLLDRAGLTFSVGQLGAGESETLASCDVLLATLSSASRYQLEPPAAGALLIVDEVHRAGAPTWAAALEPGFNQRLGLTATYEREDLGIEEHLDPYFSGVCASVGYGEALRDGVIAPFKVAHVGVRFTASEQDEYDRFAKQAAERRRQLIDDWGCPAEPFGEFLRAVHRLSASGIPKGSRVAGFYLSAFSKRRAVLSNATAKFRRLQDLTAAVHAAEKTIVFTQTKQAAADAVAALADGQIAGAVLHAGMDLDARAKVFGGFEDGTHELVAAPRLLDEGVDVPAADLGIVIAASRSRRQMIQRMGRILRRKADGRPARFVIMFVEGSSEDPQQPGHEGFLELITPYALDVQRFDGTATPSAISRYLEPLTKADISVESEWSTEGNETPDKGYASLEELEEARYSVLNFVAAEAGDPSAQYNLGLLLMQADPPALEEARHWYTAAAEAGNTNAQYNLGLLLAQADPPDHEEARHWWSLAATAGNTNAQYNLGLLLAQADPPEYEEARHWYTAAAEAGDPSAQYNLGLLLMQADPPELEEARRWYTAAAEAGHPAAQNNLGILLAEADPPELEEARRWYTAAAEAGYTDAKHNLGLLLVQVDPPEYEEARHWLSLAATAGNAQGQYSLGLLLMQAYPAEYEEARHWWNLAATAGHTDAQYNLGVLLEEDDPPELEEARHWYTAAAESGHTDAQYNLGLLLMQADPPEYEEARHWYTAAAESGHAKAQYSLGLLLVQADPPEYEEARHWWSLAATAGHTPAQNYLGVLLFHADPPEYEEARHWWNLAATAGNADAQYNLGVVLAEADPPEYGEARHWYTAAAESGHTDAQYNLGLLLAQADPPEDEEARHWFSLAAEAGHPAAQNNLGILLEAADPPRFPHFAERLRLI